ncbi:MAG: hypothetical protein ACREQM_04600 [Candidatus Dormibacteraceae bacterium]
MVVEIVALVLAVLLIVAVGVGAAYTIRARGSSPPLPTGATRRPFRQPLAVVFWLLMLGLSALLSWANETPLHPTTSTIVSLVLVGTFYAIPAWRAADRFQGKPWSRRMTADFTISILTLAFSGWGLIELALRDSGDLELRLITALIAVLLVVALLPAGLRRLLGGASARS